MHAKATEFRSDMSVAMEAKDTYLDYWRMYLTLNREVDSWIRAARSGRKDDARDFLRFCRMAHFVEILQPVSGDQPVRIDASNLDFKLRELERWCHPQSGNDAIPEDISGLHKKLDAIAGELVKLAQKISPQKSISPALLSKKRSRGVFRLGSIRRVRL